MTAKTVTLLFVCAVAIAGLLGQGQRSSSGQQQENVRKQQACTIFCGDGTFNTITLGVKPCWGGPLPAGDAGNYFKGLPEADQNTVCQTLTEDKSHGSCPAFKTLMQACKDRKKPDGKDKPPCDTAKLCATLNSAYQSVSNAVETLNSGGRPSMSFADFKANLSRQLDTIQNELQRCNNPSDKITQVKHILAYPVVAPHTPLQQLEEVQRALNSARVDFMQSGGPCYAMPPSTAESPGGDPPPPPPLPPRKSPGSPQQGQQCKEGEKPKTEQDNAAINQLISALGQDISKLEQQAKVLRGSRQLAAVRAKIEKLKKIRTFWRQVMDVECVPPEIVQLVRSYLQERQANGDTKDACSQLCSATSAWVEQQTNSNLQMNFSMDRCLASCK